MWKSQRYFQSAAEDSQVVRNEGVRHGVVRVLKGLSLLKELGFGPRDAEFEREDLLLGGTYSEIAPFETNGNRL